MIGSILLNEKIDLPVATVFADDNKKYLSTDLAKDIDKNEDFLYEVNQKYKEYGEYGFLSTNDSLGKIRLHNDKLTAEELAKAKEIFYTADAAAYGKDEEKFLQYFDLESWAKMYLLQMFTMNSDSYYGSLYFYYNGEDGKLYFVYKDVPYRVDPTKNVIKSLLSPEEGSDMFDTLESVSTIITNKDDKGKSIVDYFLDSHILHAIISSVVIDLSNQGDKMIYVPMEAKELNENYSHTRKVKQSPK